MNRTLTVHSTLETLKKEARRWLKAIRAGDAEAIMRMRTAGIGTAAPGLRDVQFALAREVVLHPLEIVSIPAVHLGVKVGSLADSGQEIMGALDELFSRAWR